MRKQSILSFFIYGPGAKILAFSHLTISHTLLPKLQKIKWPYLGSWATDQKTNDTFFSSTFKVWESKVSLVFQFMAQGPRYLPFFPWRWHVLLLLRFKRRNPHISAPGPQIKKLRTLSFLQFLKFEKARYPFFLIYGPGAKILAFVLVTMVHSPPLIITPS